MSTSPDLNPGRGLSFDAYASSSGLDTKAPGTLAEFTAVLGVHRAEIARRHGMTVDDLHAKGMPSVQQEPLILDGETARQWGREHPGV